VSAGQAGMPGTTWRGVAALAKGYAPDGLPDDGQDRHRLSLLCDAIRDASLAEPDDLGAAWAAAEAAMAVPYRTRVGTIHDHKRYDLSVHRTYETVVDGVEQYAFEARVTLPGIHYYPATGPTPAAALRALAALLADAGEGAGGPA
jgi:hypothetical protein